METKRPPPLLIASDGRKYLIERKINEGVYAEVLEVLSPHGSRSAAKKSKDRVYQNVKAEAEIYTKFANIPGSVQMKYHFDTPRAKHHVIGMELIPCGNLFEEFLDEESEKKLSFEQVFNIARQAAFFLEGLEQKGIIHRDLKPENMFLDTSGVLKIGDYGSATDLANRKKGLVQSRFYRAPEIFLFRSYNFAIDMWSLGCILFELYTKEVLFYSEGDDLVVVSDKCYYNYSLFNNHLNTIYKRLGQRPNDNKFVLSLDEKIREAYFAFDGENYTPKPPTSDHILPSLAWKKKILAIAKQRGDSVEQANTLIELIGRMIEFNPKKRIQPLELLALIQRQMNLEKKEKSRIFSSSSSSSNGHLNIPRSFFVGGNSAPSSPKTPGSAMSISSPALSSSHSLSVSNASTANTPKTGNMSDSQGSSPMTTPLKEPQISPSIHLIPTLQSSPWLSRTSTSSNGNTREE